MLLHPFVVLIFVPHLPGEASDEQSGRHDEEHEEENNHYD